MKIKIGHGQLHSVFQKARRHLYTLHDIKTIDSAIDLFEKTYNIEFIDGSSGSWADDQLIFKSEEEYFAFLMKWV